MGELLDLFSEDDTRKTGQAERSLCHGNPALIHRAVRIAVYHPDGRMLLQKRSMSKRVQPGKWDAAVGGHVAAGEDLKTAAERELSEELGRTGPADFQEFYTIRVRNDFESENVHVYRMVCPGPFFMQESEVDELRFFSPEELKKLLDATPEMFTPLLQRELREHLLSPLVK